MNWCILIPLLTGLISAILGYLLGRMGGSKTVIDNSEDWKLKVSNLEAELEASKKANLGVSNSLGATKVSASDDTALKTKISNLEADLKACEKSRKSLQADLETAKKATVSALLPFDADKAKAVFGKKIKQDDLTLVEGIGPKIQELFHNHGVKTWKELSECSLEKCQEVLNSGGERYKIHTPDTWPEQARMAYEGLWQKLFDWQEELDGGKIV